MSKSDIDRKCETIKSSINLRDAVVKYGFEPNRQGFICCPFHRENTPSLKIYSNGRGWVCFGCHAGGTLIDFVSKLFNLSITESIARIDSDFGLGLECATFADKVKYRAEFNSRQADKTKKQELEKLQRYEVDVLCACRRGLIGISEFAIEHLDRLLDKYLDQDFTLGHDVNAHCRALYERWAHADWDDYYRHDLDGRTVSGII